MPIGIVDPANVAVADALGKRDFLAKEALRPFGIKPRIQSKDLESYGLLLHRIQGFVHLTHPATAEQLHNLEPPSHAGASLEKWLRGENVGARLARTGKLDAGLRTGFSKGQKPLRLASRATRGGLQHPVRRGGIPRPEEDRLDSRPTGRGHFSSNLLCGSPIIIPATAAHGCRQYPQHDHPSPDATMTAEWPRASNPFPERPVRSLWICAG